MGDLAMCSLGPSEVEVERFSKEVDAIVHAGMEGFYLNSYQQNRPRQSRSAPENPDPF